MRLNRVLVAVVLLLAMALPAAATSSTGETSDGQELSISIDSPVDGESVAEAIEVVGRAAVGGLSTQAHVLLIVDVSGSASNIGYFGRQDCNADGTINTDDDINGNGKHGEILDCEVAAVAAALDALAGTSAQVGLISFNSGATISDVDPTTDGTQQFTAVGADADGDGIDDVLQQAMALRAGGSTDFDAPLRRMNTAFASVEADSTKLALFMSDGIPSDDPSESTLAEAAAAGHVVNTYPISFASEDCEASQMARIAERTGGECTKVLDPADLPETLGSVRPVGIEEVTLTVDEGEPALVDLNVLGDWRHPVEMDGGYHDLTATVRAEDGTTLDVTVSVCVTEGTVSGTVEEDVEPVIAMVDEDLAEQARDTNCGTLAEGGG